MKNHLDTKQLQALCRVYSTTQFTKESAIEEMVACWGSDTTRLYLDRYSDWTLRTTVKVAHLIGIDEANQLLELISLRRLRLDKRGGGSL